MIRVNKTELIDAVAGKADLSKADAEKALNAVLETVEEELSRGEEVQITGFGSFKVTQRAAREGRNPQTGEPMQIPATKTPNFSAGNKLKEAVR